MDEHTEQATTDTVEQTSAGTDSGEMVPAQLITDRGTTSIEESVIAKIAGIATREIDGVAGLGGTVSGAFANLVSRIRSEEASTSGVGVEVGTRQAAADLVIRATYPTPLKELTDKIRDNVIDRIETLTGLEVVEVNIVVTDLVFPGSEDEAEEQPSRVE